MTKRKPHKPNRFAVALITLGTLFLGIWSIHRYYYHASLSLSDQLISQYASTVQSPLSPLYIEIPTIAKLSVVEAGKTSGVWTVSDKGANHVRQSAIPESGGNIIIYGHNTSRIFGNLIGVKNGAIISIISRNGTTHQYQVILATVVDTSDTSLLAPTSTEVLTLYTCTGWLDSKRFVVRAVPV